MKTDLGKPVADSPPPKDIFRLQPASCKWQSLDEPRLRIKVKDEQRTQDIQMEEEDRSMPVTWSDSTLDKLDKLS